VFVVLFSLEPLLIDGNSAALEATDEFRRQQAFSALLDAALTPCDLLKLHAGANAARERARTAGTRCVPT
jgi:hypothetical protein